MLRYSLGKIFKDPVVDRRGRFDLNNLHKDPAYFGEEEPENIVMPEVIDIEPPTTNNRKPATTKTTKKSASTIPTGTPVGDVLGASKPKSKKEETFLVPLRKGMQIVDVNCKPTGQVIKQTSPHAFVLFKKHAKKTYGQLTNNRGWVEIPKGTKIPRKWFDLSGAKKK